MNTTNKPILLQLDELEAVAVDFIVKAVVWLTPAFTAILLYHALQQALALHWLAAGVGAAVIELAGLGFMHAAMSYFYEWRGEQPAKINFIITSACVLGYVLTAFTIALVIKLPGELATWGRVMVPPLAVVLSMQSALVGSVRASTYKSRLLQNTHTANPRPTRRRSPVRKRPTEQTPEERAANRDQANAVRTPGQADFDRAAQLKSQGLTWPEVGRRIGRSASTAKRWAALASDAAEEPVSTSPQPIVSISQNGKGNHQ